jgi:RecJ-like exonuclease
MGPVPELEERAVACANRLREADGVLLASHIDADGLTSAAIATTALERAGIPVETMFAKQLDTEAIASIAAADYETVLFTDFGSGQLDTIAEHETEDAFTPIIADHHQPADADTEYHLNPLLFGINGASELSGAGASYVLARALAETGPNDAVGSVYAGRSATADRIEADGGAADVDSSATGPDGGTTELGGGATDANDDRSDRDAVARADNTDLAGLAIVGAVGDMQASDGGLQGANKGIVEEGVEAGVLAAGTDLTLYGRQTRPLPKLLEYASEARIPGITNDEAGSIAFLSELKLDLKDSGEWRRWVDLSDAERQAVVSALIQRAVASGVPPERVEDLVGTTYTLTAEAEGTELRDVSEFSTLLNATARYERADVGLAVCLGDRGAALERARTLLSEHRRNLSEGLRWVKEEGVTIEDNVQWFDAGDRIRETIVGIVAGMAVGADGVRHDLPIVAFARKNDTELKVSARGSHSLVRQGLDLSVVMGEASRSVGGDGGGHDVAAGATIPAEQRSAFLSRASDIVAEQLGEAE